MVDDPVAGRMIAAGENSRPAFQFASEHAEESSRHEHAVGWTPTLRPSFHDAAAHRRRRRRSIVSKPAT
jgi:hypothetical protein